MDKYELISRIEKFAPLELQEKWDCSGWLVENDKKQINKIMLCLTVTDRVYQQAKLQNCNMIIAHHPMFFVPVHYNDMNIYCAHTNMDLTIGGTTDTLIKQLNLEQYKEQATTDSFVRYVKIDISVDNLTKKIKQISNNLRVVNNTNKTTLHKIAFCAGSGSEFIEEARENGADAFVTGDVKFHTAIESDILLFDMGHFESEIEVLRVFYNLLKDDCDIIFAEEKSPFVSV